MTDLVKICRTEDDFKNMRIGEMVLCPAGEEFLLASVCAKVHKPESSGILVRYTDMRVYRSGVEPELGHDSSKSELYLVDRRLAFKLRIPHDAKGEISRCLSAISDAKYPLTMKHLEEALRNYYPN